MNRFETKQAGVLSSADLKTFKGKLLYWSMFAILIIIAIFSLVPAIWTILTAFKDTQEIYLSASFFPKNLSWTKAVNQVSEAWSKLQLGEAMWNTVILGVGNIVFKIVICGFGGYVLSKLKPTGSKLMFTLVMWTMMMPSQIRMVPSYISYINFPFASPENGLGVNLLDTFWPMWLGTGADTFAVLLFKNAFDALPDSYIEAAKIDGASNYGIFFKIMLPLSTPIIIYESITTLSAVWADFFGPLLILDKKTVLPLVIYRLKTDASVQMNTYFMALLFSCIPPFLIFAAFQKHIMGGINIGGVKG